MPQELLRDVLRTGDASEPRAPPLLGPARSRLPAMLSWSARFVISPWADGIDLPAIASPLPAALHRHGAAAAAAAAKRAVRAAGTTAGAPTEAPKRSAEEAARRASRDPWTGGLIDGPWRRAPGRRCCRISASGRRACTAPPPPPSRRRSLVRVGGTIREPRKLVHVAARPIRSSRTPDADGGHCHARRRSSMPPGRVESVRVLSSVPLLDDAAVRAVRQWRYTPTELNGVPVPVLMTITVRFSLDR